MKRLVPILFIALLQVVVTPAFADKIVRIGVAINGANVEIRALDYRTMKPHAEPISSLARLQSVFFSLECFVNSDCSALKAEHEQDLKTLGPEELVPTLKEEGEKLLGPFADLIEAADEVRFQIDWSLLKVPFDLLYLRDEPVFVSKKISYTVGRPAREERTPSRNWVGLLISDPSADPHRAFFSIEKRFPRSHSFDVTEIELSKLGAMGPVDFVAISGHGSVDGNGDGFIELGNGEKLQPGSLMKLRPKLVYFDSCNLGISAEHLRKLRDGGTAYAVAPILSNEAGDSSTATIDAFFSELAKGIDPVTALFFARSKLYERYASDDIRTMLWRSFPFRVYHLN
jgi:hypothetical protein